MRLTRPERIGPVRGGDTRRIALAALCLAQFCVVLAFQGTALALPEVDRALDLSVTTTQWLVSANALAFGGLLLPAGRAADLYGHRRVFMIGTALFAAASLAAGLAPNAIWLIAARALQGAGTALFAPAGYALLTETFTEEPAQRRALAIWTAAGPLGGIGAILLGGVLAAAFGWRAVFVLGAPVVLPALLLARSVLPESKGRQQARLDPVGVGAGVTGIGLVVYALGSLPASGEIPLRAVGTLAAGLVLVAVFIASERRSATPLIPPSLLGQGELSRSVLTAFFHGAATNTWIFFYSLYMQQMRGASPWETGLGVLPCNVAIIGGSVLGSRLGGWLPFRMVMAVGMAASAAGLFAMTSVSANGSYVVTLLPGLVLIGFGLGIAQIGIFGAATAATDETQRGVAGGMINTAAQIGTAMGLAVLVMVSSRAPGEIALLRYAFACGGMLALVGVAAAMVMSRMRSSPVARTSPATTSASRRISTPCRSG
jgi:MFS family permease